MLNYKHYWQLNNEAHFKKAHIKIVSLHNCYHSKKKTLNKVSPLESPAETLPIHM